MIGERREYIDERREKRDERRGRADPSAEAGRRRKNAFVGFFRFDLHRQILDGPSEYFVVCALADGASPRARDGMRARVNRIRTAHTWPTGITCKGVPALACSAVCHRAMRCCADTMVTRNCAKQRRTHRTERHRTRRPRHLRATSVGPPPAVRMTGGYCALRENFDLVYADATPHQVPGSSPWSSRVRR
jgi:hypothetical protein